MSDIVQTDAGRALCVDLCCGSGGWAAGFLAEGYDVLGVDILPQPDYPGRLIVADVRELGGRQFAGATVIVASPPCEQFSRHQMPWTRRRNPPEPNLSIVDACRGIAAEASVQRGKPIPFVMENVRAAQRWLGPAEAHVGPFYLWGDVPVLLPNLRLRKKESRSSTARAERARIPFELARHVALCFRAGGLSETSIVDAEKLGA